MPSRHLWDNGTIGKLQSQDFLYKGGWWHSPAVLEATGRGLVEEEPRAWEGFWNERIVELVKMSTDNESDALAILLTGRGEAQFSDLLTRMITAKKLDFPMVCLKPDSGPNGEHFASTLDFKQTFLADVMNTYTGATLIRVYEDRIKQVKGFNDFFENMNSKLMTGNSNQSVPGLRYRFDYKVVHVTDVESSLDPEIEAAEIQKMINFSNRAILDGTAPANQLPYKMKRTVFYTGYLISPQEKDKLLTLLPLSPEAKADMQTRLLANNILITPRPAQPSILQKVGGLRSKMRWKVTGVGSADQKVWAARVEPADPGTPYFTENKIPYVVLALRRDTKPIEANRIRHWTPVRADQAFVFETTVGEAVKIRIDKEVRDEDEYEAAFPNVRNAGKHPREEDFPPLGASRAGDGKSKSQQRNQNHNNRYGRGGGIGSAAQRGGGGNSARGRGGNANNFRGGRGSRGGGGSRGSRGGRGGRGGYRDLDDNVGQGYGGGGMQY